MTGQADVITDATRIYRAWEAEYMLDGEEPSPAGPSAVDKLIVMLLGVAKHHPAIREELSNG